jgi:hypothetical protein
MKPQESLKISISQEKEKKIIYRMGENGLFKSVICSDDDTFQVFRLRVAKMEFLKDHEVTVKLGCNDVTFSLEKVMENENATLFGRQCFFVINQRIKKMKEDPLVNAPSYKPLEEKYIQYLVDVNKKIYSVVRDMGLVIPTSSSKLISFVDDIQVLSQVLLKILR